MIARVLSALLLLVAFVPYASACEDGASAERALAQVVRLPDAYAVTAVASIGTHHCDCPAPPAETAVPPAEPRNERGALPADRRLLERSLAELSLAADSRSKRLADAAPSNVLALYLLTARLRR